MFQTTAGMCRMLTVRYRGDAWLLRLPWAEIDTPMPACTGQASASSPPPHTPRSPPSPRSVCVCVCYLPSLKRSTRHLLDLMGWRVRGLPSAEHPTGNQSGIGNMSPWNLHNKCPGSTLLLYCTLTMVRVLLAAIFTFVNVEHYFEFVDCAALEHIYLTIR